MNLFEKLKICENYMKNKGYEDASIVAADISSQMVIFRIPNVTAKYPNEHPNVSVAFAKGTLNSDEIDFDVMQVMCFISSGVPENRLLDIQKFCSDFNKAMQIGFFGVDFKNGNVYFKSAQVIDKNISKDRLETIIDDVLTMILFYFGYAYEILIELSYGVIGYGSTPEKLKARKQIIAEAMEELRDDEPDFIKNADVNDRNEFIEEIFNQLVKDNPEVLAKAEIDVDTIRRRRTKKSQKNSKAEETAKKILELAEAEKIGIEKPIMKNEDISDNEKFLNIENRKTITEKDAVTYKNQMPSVEMFAKREKRRSEPPLDMEELRRALEIEQEERARINALRYASEEKIRQNIEEADIVGKNNETEQNKNISSENQESLLQKLRKWTQN